MSLGWFRPTAIVLLSTAPLFRPAPLYSWGCQGHVTIALIAEKHLTPEVRARAEKLLAENPVDPQLPRYCGQTSADLFADASTWPDDVRGRLKNGPWHYIDIPRGAERGPLEPFCGSQGCIRKAITEQFALLRDPSAPPRLRADALRYLIHFVGDLHMPLHAATNDDEGGNCVPVQFFRRLPHPHLGSFAPNLHSIWDTAIVVRDMEGAEPAEYAELLSESFSSEIPAWQSAGMHIDDWLWESHDLAETVAYGGLVPKIPIETPAPVHSCTDQDNIGERMLRLHLRVGQSYQDSAAPVVRKRIAQAGIRLAVVLSEALQSTP